MADLTEEERHRIGRVLGDSDTLVYVVPGGPVATVIDAIIAERLAARDAQWRAARDRLADYWGVLGKGDPPSATQVRAIEPDA